MSFSTKTAFSGRQGRAAADEGAGGPIVLDPVAGETLVLPRGIVLSSAEFVRQGSDLLLRTVDGETILVKGYFALSNPPSLMTDDGGVYSPELAATLAGPMAPGQYAEASTAPAGTVIGRVTTVEGMATATRADGTVVVLSVDAPVFQGDLLETEAGASVGLVFNDNSTFAVDENARLVLDHFAYDQESGEGSSLFSIVEGVVAFVSGEIAANNPEEMVLQTPIYMLGVRGTNGAIAAGTGNDTVTLLPDADGTLGSMVVTNGAGQFVLDQPNQTLSISGASSVPEEVQLSADDLASLFGSVLKSRPTPSSRERGDSDGDSEAEADGEAEAEGEAAESGEDAAGDSEDSEQTASSEEAEEAAGEETDDALSNEAETEGEVADSSQIPDDVPTFTDQVISVSGLGSPVSEPGLATDAFANVTVPSEINFDSGINSNNGSDAAGDVVSAGGDNWAVNGHIRSNSPVVNG